MKPRSIPAISHTRLAGNHARIPAVHASGHPRRRAGRGAHA